MENKNYITPGGFKRLQDEYNYLTKIERPRITKLVTWAASLGDRSENADYLYGKKRLREIDRRLRFLGKRIEASQIINPKDQMGETILFGATVKIEAGGETRTYSIIGEDEIDLKKGFISWRGPIARALLGSEQGDQVCVKSPTGTKNYDILCVKYISVEIEEFKYES